MSFTRRIALAGTLAVALLATSAAPTSSARPLYVHADAAALSTATGAQTFAAASVQVVTLTPADMTLVQGDGIFGWLKKTIKKAVKWLKKHWDTIEKIIEIIEDIIDLFQQDDGTSTSTVTTDHYKNQVEVNEYYNSEEELNAGIVASVDQSETGFVYLGTTVTSGGGGGGGTCIDTENCQPYMY